METVKKNQQLPVAGLGGKGQIGRLQTTVRAVKPLGMLL